MPLCSCLTFIPISEVYIVSLVVQSTLDSTDPDLTDFGNNGPATGAKNDSTLLSTPARGDA